MTEILFLWFGIVACIYGCDLWEREHPLSLFVGLVGLVSVGVYVVSVVTLP